MRFSDYVSNFSAPLFMGVCAVAILAAGWLRHDEEYLTPKKGLGYWLGVVGASLILLLLLYSYRKRRRNSLVPGSIPTWFRIHMVLGVAGPILILYHSNFRLGALNSNVALFTMLTVMASGVVGRYIYGKIHIGFDGRKALVQEIFSDIEEMRAELGHDLDGVDALIVELNAFSHDVLKKPPRSAMATLREGAMLVVKSRILHMHMRAHVREIVGQKARREGWSRSERRRRAAESETRICAYFSAVLKAMELRFYERLFALWHILHLPLFFLMIATGLVHVWAVHRY